MNVKMSVFIFHVSLFIYQYLEMLAECLHISKKHRAEMSRNPSSKMTSSLQHDHIFLKSARLNSCPRTHAYYIHDTWISHGESWGDRDSTKKREMHVFTGLRVNDCWMKSMWKHWFIYLSILDWLRFYWAHWVVRNVCTEEHSRSC